MKKILGFCSPCESETALRAKLPGYNILESQGLNGVIINSVINNKNSLQSNYNKWIRVWGLNGEEPSENILVLTHDDVVITDKHWVDKLQHALQVYDVVGLAGGSNPTIKEPALWHLMCARDTWKGTVSHLNHKIGKPYKTVFGPQGRVLILDGLFLAFKPFKMRLNGIEFDESNPAGFHYYDIDFCLQCNKKKLTLGTVNIDVVHNSPGLSALTPEWQAGQKWFLDKVHRGEY